MQTSNLLAFWCLLPLALSQSIDTTTQIPPPPPDFQVPPATIFPTLPTLFPPFGLLQNEVNSASVGTTTPPPGLPMDPFMALLLPLPMTPSPQSPPGPPLSAGGSINFTMPPPIFPDPFQAAFFPPAVPDANFTTPTPMTFPPFVTFPPIPMSWNTFNITSGSCCNSSDHLLYPEPQVRGRGRRLPPGMTTMRPMAIPMHDMNYTKQLMEYGLRTERTFQKMPQMLSEGPRTHEFPDQYRWFLRSYGAPTMRHEKKMGNVFVDDRMRGVRLYTFCRTCGRGR